MYERKPNASVGVERTSRRKRKKLDRLTRDAIAAQEAGMSYGQYKALHPHTPDEDDEKEPQAIEPDSVVAVCEFCGGRFIKRKNNNAKSFCSAACQNRHNYHKHMERKRQDQIGQTATCEICGATFTMEWGRRKYCSSECYAEGQRKRSRERWEQHRKDNRKEAAENGSI